ncbi:MAG: DUF1427 family protein [Devosia sp.]
MDWKPYAVSLAIGLLVGGLYALLNTRSPAPPIIALLGLLGMLAGEAAVSWAKSRVTVAEAAADCLHAKRFDVASSDDRTKEESQS